MHHARAGKGFAVAPGGVSDSVALGHAGGGAGPSPHGVPR